VVVTVAGLRLPFKEISPADLLPAGDWPSPTLLGASGGEGPVQVTIEYHPGPGSSRM
jgi:hypothetical protein